MLQNKFFKALYGRNMRKILALLASVCIISVLLLVGCESAEPTPTGKPEITGMPEDFSVYVSSEVTIPEVQYTEGASLSVSVNDPSGAAVPVTEGKFIPTAVGKYVITYKVTLKEEETEKSITVTVIDTDVPPTIALEGENVERVLKDTQVVLTAATAKDAFGKELVVTIKVTSPSNIDVALTDGTFTATEKGEYKVVYSVTDAFGNTATIEDTILCYNQPQTVVPVPEDVKNSFESEEECKFDRLNAETSSASFTHNSTEDDVHAVKSGAYSLKVTTTGGGTFNLVSEAICGSKDFSGMGTLSFWAYNGNGAAVGMSIYNVVLTGGASKNVNIYKLLPIPVAGSEAQAWTKYEINLIDCGFTAEQLKDVYSLSLWVGAAGTYYIDDIAWDNRADYVTLGDVQERIEAAVGDQVAVESPAVSPNAQLVVTVIAPDGQSVNVVDGKFTVENVGIYTITYTAKGTVKELTKRTSVVVSDPTEEPIPDNVYSFEQFEGEANTLNTFATAADRACTSIEMSSGKANAHSGSRSIHFTVNTEVVVGWLPAKIFGTQKFDPSVGSISFWVRSVNGGKFTLWGVNTVSPSGTVYGTNQFELPAGVWTEITVDLTEAKYDDYRKSDGGIEIYWIKFTAAVGEYYLDDFTIHTRPDYVAIEEVASQIDQDFGEVTIAVPGVSEGATLTITVTDPDGNEVEYSSDYKFMPTRSGDYTITYSATNGLGSDTKSTVLRIGPKPVGPVAENVQNSFETAAQRGVTTTKVWTDNSTNDNAAGVRSGAYSKMLKTTAKQSADGFTLNALIFNGTQDLSAMGTLSVWLYNAGASEVTFRFAQIILADTTKHDLTGVEIAVPAGQWRQLSLDLVTCGLTEEQLKAAKNFKCSGSAALHLFLDDISWSSRENHVSIGDVGSFPEKILGEEVTVTLPEVSEGAELTVSVTDPDGVSVSLSDTAAFTPEKTGLYVIKFTATKGGFSVEKIVNLTVKDPV